MTKQWIMQKTFCVTAIAVALTWTAALQPAQAASDLDTYFPLLEWDRNYLDGATPGSAGSGVTYWRDRNMYLVLDNTVVSGAARLLEYNRSHVLQRTISLVGFTDPEDIHLISGNTFVISQEYRSSGPASLNELVVIDVPTSGTTLNISSATRRLQIDSTFSTGSNSGIEGVAYLNGYFYFTTETTTTSPGTWRMWRLPNSGNGSVTPTDLFSVSTLASGRALDISGMATDGTDLWLLSDIGPSGGPRGRVIRCTITGTLVADYELTSFPTTPTATQWTQPEGIELFVDPATGIMNLLIMGEVGSGGVEFQRYTVPTVTITANDPTAAETCLDPGTFQVTRTTGGYTSSSLNVTYNTPTGTATQGSDYSSLSGPASIAANALSGLVTISPIAGVSGESAETVILTLANAAGYVVVSPNSATVTIVEGDSYAWDLEPDGISDRVNNTVVFTGTDVIVWGGGQTWDIWLNDGAKYNLSSGTWTAISASGAPAGRWSHTAVWTGTEMIVWGGRPSFYSENHYNDGGAYNPATDTWRSISTTGAPVGRSQMVSVWTGKEMIVWGGHADGADERSDGGAYNPVTDTWRSISTSGAPAGRIEPTAVWTGTEMLIFGGLAVDDYLGANEAWSSFGVGARYNPATDTWSSMSSSGAASSRTGHTAVWTGNEMIIWGGRYLSYPPDEVFLNTGARYNPTTDSWTAITTTGAPTARASHAAAWTGTRMIVWGGYSDPSPTEENTGGEYSPYGNCSAWTATSNTGVAAARFFGGPNAAIWTPAGMFIYGGWDYPYTLNTTALYKRN